MPQTILLSFPMALLWMIIARQFSPFGFAIGYVFGFGILTIIRINTSFNDDDQPVHPARLPMQLIALVVYAFRLTVDVLVSGFDVATRVIRPSLPIDPDVQIISTQDESDNQLVSALSAHSITITPGELVVDFGEDEQGKTTMLVHTLDKNSSNIDKLNRDQTRRLKIIRQMLGINAEDIEKQMKQKGVE